MNANTNPKRRISSYSQKLLGFWNLGCSRLNKIFTDKLIVLLILFIAAVNGISFVSSKIVTPSFYQNSFGPAVELACKDSAKAQDPVALNDFLSLKRQNISCNEVPSELPYSHPGEKLLQKLSAYLLGTVGLLWRLTGVSWDAIKFLDGVLFAISSAFAYGIFRLGTGKLVSILATLVLIFSDLQLSNLPHLRDYSKTPFIFATVFMIGFMVRYPLNRSQLLIFSGLTGFILGLGIGFRSDLILFAPLLPITICFFLPFNIGVNLKNKILSLILYVVIFIVTCWPILKAMGGSGNMLHVVLLGLMSPFDIDLRIIPAIYEWGYRYNDTYVWEVVSSFAERAMGAVNITAIDSSDYGRAGLAYYLEIFKQFPADIFIRFLAAAINILGIANSSARWSIEYVPWLTIVVLIIISIKSFRKAIFTLLMILFLCGYPSLQFAERHYFYLQIVPIWILALTFNFILVQCNRAIQKIILHEPFFKYPKFPLKKWEFKNILFFLIIAILLPITLLLGLRVWQQISLKNNLKIYSELPVKTVDFKVENNEDEVVSLTIKRPESFFNPHPINVTYPLDVRYWLIEFDSNKCEKKDIDIHIQYKAQNLYVDHSRIVKIPFHQGRTKYFFATYSKQGESTIIAYAEHVFSGISMDKESFACFASFSQVLNLEKVGLLPSIILQSDWSSMPLFQRFALNNQSSQKKVDMFYGEFGVTEKFANNSLNNMPFLSLENLSWRDKQVLQSKAGLAVSGVPESKYTYLMQLKRAEINASRTLIASGRLIKGGLTIGVIDDDKWVKQINITEPQKFTVAIKLKKGNYTPLIASNLPNGEASNNFEIYKFGWDSPPENDSIIYNESGVPSEYINNSINKLPILSSDNLAWQAEEVRPSKVGMLVSGVPITTYSYLMQLNKLEIEEPKILIVSGILKKGGITIGAIDNTKWLSQVNITQPQKFIVAIKLSRGMSIPTIASNLPIGQKNNDFEIFKFGIYEIPSAMSQKH